MALQPQYVLLTVTAGESQAPQQRLEWGTPSPILSVGAKADWVISGDGVADVHLLLSFDGRRVRVAAASETARIEVEGMSEGNAVLGNEWRALDLPFELRLGSARLAGQAVGGAGARASSVLPDFAASERGAPSVQVVTRSILRTQVLDLAALRAPAVERQAPALEGQATLSVGRDTAPFQVASGSTMTWSLGTLLSGPPPRASSRIRAEEPAKPSAALDRTLCDGGALRDYARKLVADTEEPAVPVAANPEARSPKLERAKRALALPRRLLALPVHRRLLAMPLLASLALLPWLLGNPSAAQVSDSSEPASRAEAAPPAEATPRAEVAPPAEAIPASEAPPPPEAAPPAEAAPRPEAAPPLKGAPPAEADSVATKAAPAQAAAHPRSNRLQQDAFRAAFGGSVTEAAALYDELARLRGEPVFEHAARLVRQNRVHKP